MATSRYIDALVLTIYENCLSKRSRKYKLEETVELQQRLAVAVSNKDVAALESLLVYYEDTQTMYALAIKYGMR